MGGLKTYLCAPALFCALALPDGMAKANPAFAADTLPADDQMQFFATCAGRMSALMEHQWMFDGPASDATKAQRDTMLSLADALALPDDMHRILLWRVEAKQAQAALLSLASFGPKDARDRAARQADALIAPCSAVLS